MKWHEIFEELRNEKTVVFCDGYIEAELDRIIGDIPVYKFKVQYFKAEGENGFLYTEYVHTFEELNDLISREPAFTKCACCGALISGGAYEDIETKELTCSFKCFTEHLKKKQEEKESCEHCEGCTECGGCTTFDSDEDTSGFKDISEFTPEEMESLAGFAGNDDFDFEGFDELETDDGDYTSEE